MYKKEGYNVREVWYIMDANANKKIISKSEGRKRDRPHTYILFLRTWGSTIELLQIAFQRSRHDSGLPSSLCIVHKLPSTSLPSPPGRLYTNRSTFTHPLNL